MNIACAKCKNQRPAGEEPCPHCGTPPYPHRRTAEEHADHLEAIRERDREGAALEGRRRDHLHRI